MPFNPPPAFDLYGCLRTLAAFFIIVSPLYLLMRFFVRMIRVYYGFDTGDPDAGPPLRVCDGCHNTVLEPDYQHCPYCGRALPLIDDVAEGRLPVVLAPNRAATREDDGNDNGRAQVDD